MKSLVAAGVDAAVEWVLIEIQVHRESPWDVDETVLASDFFRVDEPLVIDEFTGIDLYGKTASPKGAMMSIKRINRSADWFGH